MVTVGGLLLALAASLLILLAIPIDLAFSLQRRDGRQTGGIAIGWLFGAVRVPLARRARAKPNPPRLVERADKRGRALRAVSMVRTGGFFVHLLKLAQALLRRVRVRTLSLDIRLGLDDPADTGRLWAVVGPLAAMLPLPPAARLSIEPDFAEAVFEVDGRGNVRIMPILWVAAILVFLLSPATLRALSAWRSTSR